MTSKREVRILVTGGGTGGHVSPALAVIQQLRERAFGAERQLALRYIGSEGGVEKAMASAAGVEFVGVQTGKLRRSQRITGLLSRKNLQDALRIPVGIVQAMRQVKRFRPDVVFATGGYVSVPPVIAARLLRIPILIHEQTVQVGLANRIAARCADRVALSVPEAAHDLPPGLRSRTFVTGNPVREIIFTGDKACAVTRFGFSREDNALLTVYVTGGAQGAQSINRAIEDILPDLLTRCRVIHQCGKQAEGQPQDVERLQAVAAKLSTVQQSRYFVGPFIADEIGDVYALTDLVVGRSGAGTVAEACALGKPAVFIPLVPTGGDEQTRNAQRMVEAGAAVLLPGAELTGPRLREEIETLLGDPSRLTAMGAAAQTLAHPNAASDLAAALLQLADAT